MVYILDIRDKSGVKLYVTKNYRKTEFGVLTAGMGIGGLLIPPKAERMDFNFHCQKNCTNVCLSLNFHNFFRIFFSIYNLFLEPF